MGRILTARAPAYRPNRRIHVRKANALPPDSEGGRGFGSVFRHHYLKNQPLSVGFFCPSPPVLARVRATLRRTPPPRPPPFRAVLRSLFPPILCFCEGRRCTYPSIGAGFRLLVCQGKRLNAGDTPPGRGYALTMERTSQAIGIPGQ